MKTANPIFRRLTALLTALALCLSVAFVGTGSVFAAGNQIRQGDLNSDGLVNADDAVYLLYHCLFGEAEYPVSQRCDFNGSGPLDADDAIYLLYHTLFGDEAYPLPNMVEVTLSASKTECAVGDNGTIYFYATVSGGADSVVLVNSTTGETVCTLVDDGAYSVSGDDLPGDGVYSGIVQHDTSADKSFDYHVVVDGDEALTSSGVQIRIQSGFTAKQIDDMAAVDQTIQEDIFAADGFENAIPEDRAALAEEVLNELAADGKIKAETILYSEETETYTFQYESGALGAVIMGDWDAQTNGMTYEERVAARETSSAVNSMEELNVSNPAYVGEAIVLWAFGQAWDDSGFRRPFYQQLESDLEAQGLDTTVDWETTVEDFKVLEGYEVVMFSGHGAAYDFYYDGRSASWSSLVLCENSTSSKDQQYHADLQNFRIGKLSLQGGTKYGILPEFFNYYYSAGDLDGTFVYFESCESHGAYGNIDDRMSEALLNASVEAVVDFHNSVLAVYCRELMQTWVEELIAGATAEEAFDTATGIHGSSDGQAYNTAYPILSGDGTATLGAGGLRNGDFEDSNTPNGWLQSGDTRVISGLGSLTPPSNSHMAILTTGIGSAEAEYQSATEGSVLAQTFKVPEGMSNLSLTYNVVSEELPEFVGTEFDDAFAVELVVDGQTYTLAQESINSSTWYEISGIDFDGGDNTTHHTDWKTVSYDISGYVGESITIRFVIYDIGDSIYDTAALVDNVRLS